MTIGDRIKELRHSKKMTQTELAQMLGISDRSVSKWETGLTAPDISLLVPLSVILGVSTDTLLGRNENGSDELKKKAAEIYSDNGGKKVREQDYEYYMTAMEFSKKFPYDDGITLACLDAASAMLWRSKNGDLEFSDDEINDFFSIAEKSIERILKSDLTLLEKCNAQFTFTQICAIMGYEGKVQREIDKYAKVGWFRARLENAIADMKKETKEELQKRVLAQRVVTSYEIDFLLWDLVITVGKMSSIGDEYAKDTIETGKQILHIIDSFEGVMSEDLRIWNRLSVMKIIGESYIVLGDTENALALKDEITDYCEKMISVVKEKHKPTLLDTYEFCNYRWDEPEDTLRDRLTWFTSFFKINDDKQNDDMELILHPEIKRYKTFDE